MEGMIFAMRKRRRLNEILEIPKEIYTDIPNIIITGFEEIVIENSKGILEYEECFIKINTKIGIIDINGINLKLEKMNEENLKIIGNVETIELEKNRDD